MMTNHIWGPKPHFRGLNRHFKPNMRKILQISDLCISLTWNLTGSCGQQQRLRWLSRIVVKQFQDGGRPPFWKSIYRHISVKNHPCFKEFLHIAADFELHGWTSRDQKVALDRLRVRQNVFLVLKTSTNVLNWKYGDTNILSEFTHYYQNVVQPNTPNIDVQLSKEVNLMLGKPIHDNTVISAPKVALGGIGQCSKDVKRNKAGGCDGITNEHLICGDCQLVVHLSLLFNAMLQHSFVPSDFCKGIIIPLLKDKTRWHHQSWYVSGNYIGTCTVKSFWISLIKLMLKTFMEA